MAASGRPVANPAVGCFADIVALQPHQETLLSALRALARALHPTLVEVCRPGDRAVSWGWGTRKMSEAYACALPYRTHVNLAFYHGAILPDPAGRLRGTGRGMRHVPITGIEQVGDDAVRCLMRAAREERRVALQLPSERPDRPDGD